jgi:hypothetical protein
MGEKRKENPRKRKPAPPKKVRECRGEEEYADLPTRELG